MDLIYRLLLAAVMALALGAEANAQTCLQRSLTDPLTLTLNWVDNADNETGFVVERKLNGGTFDVLISITGGNITQYVDSTVNRALVANTYTYRVKAFNDVGPSPYSNEACATFAPLPPPAPNAPSGLTLSAASPTVIRASWRDNSDDEKQFRLVLDQFAPRKQLIYEAAADSTTMTLAGLTKNKTYCGRLFAVADASISAPSNDSCATTPNK